VFACEQYIIRTILVSNINTYLHHLRPDRDSNAGPTAQEDTSLPTATSVFAGHRLFRLPASGRECSLVSASCDTNVDTAGLTARHGRTISLGISEAGAVNSIAGYRD
jgi:hypothetical protein